jgi:hypothetical protein
MLSLGYACDPSGPRGNMREMVLDALRREISRLQREMSVIEADRRGGAKRQHIERTLESRRRLLNRYLERAQEADGY